MLLRAVYDASPRLNYELLNCIELFCLYQNDDYSSWSGLSVQSRLEKIILEMIRYIPVLN